MIHYVRKKQVKPPMNHLIPFFKEWLIVLKDFQNTYIKMLAAFMPR